MNSENVIYLFVDLKLYSTYLWVRCQTSKNYIVVIDNVYFASSRFTCPSQTTCIDYLMGFQRE